jgi:hypothetical protein
MTTPADTPPEVAAAEAEAAEADALVTALEERVIDGDTKVTPQQLAEQRELSRFAKLRHQAAVRKAEKAAAKAAEKARQEKHAQALELLNTGPASADRLTAAYMAAQGAVEAFLALSDEFDAAVNKAARLLQAAGAPRTRGKAEEMAGPPASPTTPRWDISFHGEGAVTFGPGDLRTAGGAAARLAVMLDDLNTRHKIRRAPSGGPEFVNETVKVQANRARGTLHPALDKLAAARNAGGAK